jgi:hypothetical protein
MNASDARCYTERHELTHQAYWMVLLVGTELAAFQFPRRMLTAGLCEFTGPVGPSRVQPFGVKAITLMLLY